VTKSRQIARDVLLRLERDEAWIQRALPAALDDSDLEQRDKAFVTEVVYGTTRMMRACDHIYGQFVNRKLDADVRAVLRMGTYQLVYMKLPPHAAVGETVEVAPKRASGLVNAVLRKVANSAATFPDAATELSYPNWIVKLLSEDLGKDSALAALEAMNKPVPTARRKDGYVQDRASQWVSHCVRAQPDDLVLDMCAAPGGKSTALAATGAQVIAAELHPGRALAIGDLIQELDYEGRVTVVSMDGTQPGLRAQFDRVLLDAPCSGLGALRRRADARWHIGPEAIGELVQIQRNLLLSAAEMLKPGGELIYSVCTLSNAESSDMDAWLATELPQLEPATLPESLGSACGRMGERVLPSDHPGDGMACFRYILANR
jgi:16S rRNA (cytosine967-C5)-methyltransferase